MGCTRFSLGSNMNELLQWIGTRLQRNFQDPPNNTFGWAENKQNVTIKHILDNKPSTQNTVL